MTERDLTDRLSRFATPVSKENTEHLGEKFHKFKAAVPALHKIEGCNVIQNYVGWLLLDPMTIDDLVEATGVHPNTIRRAIKVLQDKQRVRIFDWKAGRKAIYVRDEILHTDTVSGKPLEMNSPLFFYGDIKGTLVDFVVAMSDPDTQLVQTYSRISGMLAHVWMRSYYSKLGYKEKLVEPFAHEVKKEFEVEIEKAEAFVRLLRQIHSSQIWSQETLPTIPLVDTAPVFIKHFSRIASDWIDSRE